MIKRIGPINMLAMLSVIMVFYSQPIFADLEKSSVDKLLNKLEERDALILDLERRLKQVEQLVGATPQATVKRSEQASAKNSQTKREPSSDSNPVSTSNQTADENGAPTTSTESIAAPGQFKVDEEAAERALERTLVQTGALLLPYGQLDVQSGFSYARREDNAGIFVNNATGGGRDYHNR